MKQFYLLFYLTAIAAFSSTPRAAAYDYTSSDGVCYSVYDNAACVVAFHEDATNPVVPAAIDFDITEYGESKHIHAVVTSANFSACNLPNLTTITFNNKFDESYSSMSFENCPRLKRINTMHGWYDTDAVPAFKDCPSIDLADTSWLSPAMTRVTDFSTSEPCYAPITIPSNWMSANWGAFDGRTPSLLTIKHSDNPDDEPHLDYLGSPYNVVVERDGLTTSFGLENLLSYKNMEYEISYIPQFWETNIETIEIHHLSYDDDIFISSNPNLNSLDFSGSTINSLGIDNNNNLTRLNLSGSSINRLTIHSNSNLVSIICPGKLQNLDIKNAKGEITLPKYLYNVAFEDVSYENLDFAECSMHEDVSDENGMYFSFTNCYNLKTLALPSIGSCNLIDIPKLEELYIAKCLGYPSVYNIGEFDFIYGESIEDFATSGYYGGSFLGNIDETGKFRDLFLSHVTGMWYGHGRSKHVKLMDLVLDNVTAVSDFAFAGYRGLRSVSLGSGVKGIGVGAFGDCANLTQVSINPETIYPFAFAGTPLLRFTLGNNIKEIYGQAFRHCGSKDAQVIFNGYLEQWLAIKHPTTWHNYYVSDGNCSPSEITSCSLYINGVLAEDIVIPESISFIPDYAFSHASSIKTVTLSSKTSMIGFAAFSNCPTLAAVYRRESSDNKSESPLIDLDACAFYNDLNLTDFSISDYIGQIKEDALYNVPWIKQQPEGIVTVGQTAYTYNGTAPDNTILDIPTGTLYIAKDAFEFQDGIVAVNFPDGLLRIEDAFMGTVNIAGTISIPGSVEYMHRFNAEKATEMIFADSDKPLKIEGGGSFDSIKRVYQGRNFTEDCRFLTYDNQTIAEYVLGPCVTELQPYAFGYSELPSLKKIVVRSTVPPLFLNDEGSEDILVEFLDYIDTENCELIVPVGAETAFRNANGWKRFAHITEADFNSVFEITAKTANDGNMEVYTLSGIKVAESTDNLAPGIYLVHKQGRIHKLMVK